MSKLNLVKYGVFGVHDSGAPTNSISNEYTTLVLIHGYAWNAGIFSKFIPLAAQNNARVVLINRRDYPGSEPYSEDELCQISDIDSDTSKGLLALQSFMKDRARELFDFLQSFVKSENISEEGGLIVAGWSLGSIWITALLAYASQFPISEAPLVNYIRRLVLYDPPYHSLGYPPPDVFYNPLIDPSLATGVGVKLFPSWVSGYYSHGDSTSELEQRNALPDPRPTIETMSSEDLDSMIYSKPGSPGGSDALLFANGREYGLFAELRKAALYPWSATIAKDASTHGWGDLELRYIWCDRSVWEIPWGTWAIQEELEDAKRSGKRARQVKLVRLKGANHFAHWDQPELALQALLED